MGAGNEEPVRLEGKEEEFDDEFFMYRAKVEMCPRQDIHSYNTCPYLHPNELVQRRDPQLFKYDSIFCYDLHNTKVCKRGISCPYSHNLFEYFLHPSRYRTRMCEFGESCKRELCFFAHNEHQLRERKPIKVHSGGRRSGKQHRGAATAPQPAPFAVAGSSSSCSSPSMQFFQVPCLVPSDSGSPAHFDFAAPEAFSQLTVGQGQQQGVADAVWPEHTATGVPVQILQPQPLKQAHLMLQQQASDASPPELQGMPGCRPGFSAGAPLLGSVCSNTSSGVLTPQGTMRCTLFDAQHSGSLAVSSNQVSPCDAQQVLIPSCVIDGGSSGARQSTPSGCLQQQILLPLQQQQQPQPQLLQLQLQPPQPQLLQVVNVSQPAMQVLHAPAEGVLVSSAGAPYGSMLPADVPSRCLPILDAPGLAAGGQYMLVRVADSMGSSSSNSSIDRSGMALLQAQQQQQQQQQVYAPQMVPAGMMPCVLPTTTAVLPQPPQQQYVLVMPSPAHQQPQALF